MDVHVPRETGRREG